MKLVHEIPLLMAVTLAGLLSWVGCSDRSEHSGGAANIPMQIEPNVAVGPVRAGMTVQQVLARLGEPERRTANALEYTHLGFAVMPNAEGIVQVVMCGDVTGINGPLVKAFTGRTQEGIGLTSTREEIVKAYGAPTSSEKMRGGTESMRYDSLGITFTIEANKVYHMIVRLTGPPTPDRSVSLEPDPSAPKK
ncbi:MAG TPA: hypothetical protein VFE51_03920 [Verrucomicrobiae bacterium]|nr:hypothetical protein [Verrucomicrobiae bacterium]